MISADTRPRLADKARLRYDRKDDKYMLLYPEQGLVLNATAAAVVKLCTGEHTVAGIVDSLTTSYADKPREDIEREVFGFLGAMADRGLVVET